MKKQAIGIFVGSLRRGSYSRSVAQFIMKQMESDLLVKIVEISHLAMFNQDFDDDGSTPESWQIFRKEVSELDGFLFVTPEYNRSYPAVIKNALDIASRPPGHNLWSGKPGAIISVSPGRFGGFGSSQHLRQVMSFLDIYLMQQPETYIGNVEDMLDNHGEITGQRAEKHLQKIAAAYIEWIERFA